MFQEQVPHFLGLRLSSNVSELYNALNKTEKNLRFIQK